MVAVPARKSERKMVRLKPKISLLRKVFGKK